MGRPKGSKNKSTSQTAADNTTTIKHVVNGATNTLTRVPWSTTTEVADNPNLEGPQKYRRDQHGLLSNVDYIFNEDGSVDWRAMVKDDQLFPNKSWFDSRKMDVPRSIEGLKDHQLLIKLGGIKEIARLRGFRDVSYTMESGKTSSSSPTHVAVRCRIEFMPNYETNGSSVTFEDMANASTQNTSSFATKFLETIACNRAFVRCVRNFLNIHIVGDDEMDKSNSKNNFSGVTSSAALTPDGMLASLAKEKLNCSNFEEFKVLLRDWWKSEKYQNPSVKEWNDFEDIPAAESRILMKLINE